MVTSVIVTWRIHKQFYTTSEFWSWEENCWVRENLSNVLLYQELSCFEIKETYVKMSKSNTKLSLKLQQKKYQKIVPFMNYFQRIEVVPYMFVMNWMSKWGSMYVRKLRKSGIIINAYVVIATRVWLVLNRNAKLHTGVTTD